LGDPGNENGDEALPNGAWDAALAYEAAELDPDFLAILTLLVTQCGLLPYFVSIIFTANSGDIMRLLMRIATNNPAYRVARRQFSFAVKMKGQLSWRSWRGLCQIANGSCRLARSIQGEWEGIYS
jgi:hypothetical protein